MASMKRHFFLFSIALFGAGCGPANSQQPTYPNRGEIEALSVPKKKDSRIATPEQEAEIRKLIEDFVISEKERLATEAEQLRREKARAIADEEAGREANANPDPIF